MRPTDPRVLARLRPGTRPLVGVVAASVAGGLLVVAQAFVVAGLVVAAVRGQEVAGWAVAVAVVVVGRMLSSALVDVCAARAAVRVGAAMRLRVARAATQVPAPMTAGELAALGTRGVAAAEPYLTRYLPALVVAGVVPPLAVVAIATQDLLSAVIVLATLPLVPLFGALVGLATRDRAESQWRAMAALSGHFVDVLRGLPTLVAFRRARAQSARIAEVTDRYRRASLGTLRIAFASSAVLELVATISVALVAVVIGVRLAEGHLALQTALTTLLLAPEAYWPLRRVGAEFHASAEGIAAFERVAELPDVPVPSRPGAGTATVSEGPLVAQGLSYTYPGRRDPAFAGVGLTVPGRGVTALVGPSGCGKSTLLAVLAGLLEPDTGRITVTGAALPTDAWQAQVAWLPQRPAFLSGTVADNLRLAAPTASRDAMWDALRRVGLTDLPGGLGALVGEDGLALSAGQRARLALARVVLAGRRWVLLDEPTAHLDAETERIVVRTLRELARSSAVVVVAHRPSVVAVADQVVELPAAPAADLPAAVVAPVVVPEPTEDGTTRSRPLPADSAAATWDPRGLRRRLALSALLATGASASGVALTATAGWLIVQAATQPPVLTLLVAIVGVRAFGLARPALRYAERLVSHSAALQLLAGRRVRVYDVLVPLTPGRIGRRRGDLLASVVEDVDAVVDAALRVRLPLWSAGLVSVLAASVAALMLPWAGALVLAVAATGGLGGHLLARAGGARREARVVATRAAVSAGLVEAARQAPELVMWQAQTATVDRIAGEAAGGDRAARGSAFALACGRALVIGATGGGVILMALLVSAAAGAVSAPVGALLVLLPLALADPLLPAAEAGAVAPRVAAAERRLSELETWAPLAVEPEEARALPSGRRLAARGLRVERGGRTVIDGLDLDLGAGERLGVVGPSGCGKSTLAAVLLRFLDARQGLLDLDGVPLRDLGLDDARSVIGLVDDDPHVFATTVVENVRLARPGATDAEVTGALRRAGLGAWLAALPDGLDTWVGDGHADVSGGERARLALARALLADPAVLVLDEPTAHLDTGTAEQVARDLLDAADGRSIVWITHGTTGLDRMDRVLTMTG